MAGGSITYSVNNVVDWIGQNKAWLFSGIAIAIPLAFFSWIITLKRKRSTSQENPSKESVTMNALGDINVWSFGSKSSQEKLIKTKADNKNDYLGTCFSKVTCCVNLLKWRDSRTNSEPFEIRQLRYLGKSYNIKIYDEAITFTERLLKDRTPQSVHLHHNTSGIMTLEPVAPKAAFIDEKVYHRSGGREILGEIPLNGSQHITYTTNRYNAFQSEEQDYIIVQRKCQINDMILRINFERVLDYCSFRVLPKAFWSSHRDRKNYIDFDSSNGKSWVARLRPHDNGQKLGIEWRLCDAFPKEPIYIFGYGSLMHPNSVRNTLPRFKEKFETLIPARLKGYCRAFSALKPNSGNSTKSGYTPLYLASMNIEKNPNSCALGTLFAASREDLRKLDIRESNYVRFDISKHIEIIKGDIPKDANIFTYISFSNIPQKEAKQDIGYRKDYSELIFHASQLIDKEHKLHGLFENDFNQICCSVGGFPVITQLIDEESNNPYAYDEQPIIRREME